jgi:octaprenyl-diphosphate synthase
MSPNAPTFSAPTISLPDLYAPIRDDLAAAQRIFDDELQSDLPFVNDMCATVRSYRGKMLRPALLLLSGQATGRLTAHHRTVAAVVEMVHMATLVHDDVLDGAEQRRKKPTIAATDGNTTAVLLGDYLISHAFHLCSSLPTTHASRRIGTITNIVCEGELMQNRRCGDLGLTERDYLEIVKRKTAVLTAVSCELGAHFATANSRLIKSMYVFGEQAGIAFQIMDDVLDLTGDAEVIGKTLGRDLAQGKLTLPFIHAFKHAGSPTRALLADALSGTAAPNPAEVAGALQDSGSIAYAVSAAKKHVQTALAQLETLPSGDAKESLVCLAEFIIGRAF